MSEGHTILYGTRINATDALLYSEGGRFSDRQIQPIDPDHHQSTTTSSTAAVNTQ